MRSRFLVIIFLIVSLPIVLSCRRNQYKINTTHIKADIEISRLEIDLFSVSPEEITDKVPFLKRKYGDCLRLFSYVIKSGEVSDSSFGGNLTGFCTDKLNNEVYNSVIKQYPDVKLITSNLEDAFRHYLWYFPERSVPSVFTCITGFNNSLIIGDSVLGISLDRYLGCDCEYYPRLEIYNYLAARMNPWNIVPDCMYGWGATEWDFNTLKYQDDNLLAEIIHEGKLRYFEKCMLPGLNDTILFGFTADQMKFCRNNEGQMWQYLIENDLLFSKDQIVLRKLIGEAPFTSYFTSESPGRAATWLGFRIIESFMAKNKNVSLRDMMDKADIQDILGEAKYSPH